MDKHNYAEEVANKIHREMYFKNLQISFLLSIIDEISTVSSDKLVVEIIKNAKERFELDKTIHAKMLFPNPEILHGSNDSEEEELEDSTENYFDNRLR